IPFADHHDIVETFPSNRPNYPLGIRVLPRGARRNHDFPDAQRLGLTPKSFAIDLVSVSEQILRSLLQAARLEQLPRRPFRGRVLGDTSRRRAWLSTTSTKSTRKVAVGTVKKSKAIRSLAWFFRNARHACDGGRRGRSMSMYFDTVACDTVRLSFSSSPWIRGAPQSGLARLIRQISSRSSVLIAGRPRRRRLFHSQKRLNPWRCQPTTVSGRTTCSECRQLVHSLDSRTQKIRSVCVSFGRGCR